MPRLKNAPLSLDQYHVKVTTKAARAAAKDALEIWYKKGYSVANKRFPQEQQNENLITLASIPSWCERKGKRNGYIMLCTIFDETPKPTVLVLDYDSWSTPSGGLSYRTLYAQVRASLKLEPNDTLRMIPFRPWYRYYTHSHPLQRLALPATDVQCRHLIGTTMLYYVV